MSRIGRAVIVIPDGVTVTFADREVRVKGPKGVLVERMPNGIDVEIAASEITFKRHDDRKESRSMHGLARALVANMVKGVVKPFVKELEIQGAGWQNPASGPAAPRSQGRRAWHPRRRNLDNRGWAGC